MAAVLAGDKLAHGGDHGFDTVAESLVCLLDAGREAVIGGAGFFGDFRDAVSEVG
jgi:hypothetical protein